MTLFQPPAIMGHTEAGRRWWCSWDSTTDPPTHPPRTDNTDNLLSHLAGNSHTGGVVAHIKAHHTHLSNKLSKSYRERLEARGKLQQRWMALTLVSVLRGVGLCAC